MSDRLQVRGPLVVGFTALGAVGFILLLATNNIAANFVGLFFAAMGVYPCIPLIVSWSANNMGGSLKKGVGTALVISIGNVSFFPFLFSGHSTFLKHFPFFGQFCFLFVRYIKSDS